MRKGLWLLFFLGLCFGIAALGSWATYPSLDPWYFELKKASWNPPGWVFGPVWTVLYLMIAFAGWQDLSQKKVQTTSASSYILFYSARSQLPMVLSLFLFSQSLSIYDRPSSPGRHDRLDSACSSTCLKAGSPPVNPVFYLDPLCGHPKCRDRLLSSY